MNRALRGGIQMLAEGIREGFQDKRVITKDRVQQLNRLVRIAKSQIWQELKQEIYQMIDSAEVVLHGTKDNNSMWDARGASNALILLVDKVEEAEAQRIGLQEQDTQDAAAAAGMGPAQAE